MQLVTERLIIREFEQKDWQDVHLYASSPLVTTHMIWGPNTEEDTKAFMGKVIEMQGQQPRKEFEMAVVLKATKQIIGGIGLYISEPKQGEIGYCFNPEFWQQGYASEAAEAMLRFGFQAQGLHRIYATCRPDNIGSAKVMQKIGMTYEGRLREHMHHKGKWHDSLLHSILEQEFNRDERSQE
ncbi:Protein N-acetyltransferase, RimJ/RimL family [Paenibacillus sp. 1_12]|uniref:GNAT family N-acetyltransferase n=1 Tax=Paenibacillus sp. 1_12 TaxID=1566278 RepID=UPI0008E88324|nr:GNAT family protein [Paenibacillus sp. 1_12]SFM14302.1 Protein N-acetyltransferase, RimJ/RimL family [Paenibacillus sp. 1_12]